MKYLKIVPMRLSAGLLTACLLLAGCGASTEREEGSQTVSAGSQIQAAEEGSEDTSADSSPLKNAEHSIPDHENGYSDETVMPEETSETEQGSDSENSDTAGTSAAALSEEEKENLRSQLLIMQDYDRYTYANMLTDTAVLLQLYPDLFTQDSIGVTADGRELVHYVVGNPAASKQIFINGAIHAREYLTFQLVMKQMCVYLQHVDQGDVWGSLTYRDMWDQVAIHVVPLVNPDGVQISQFGLDGIQNESIRDGIYQLAANDGTDVTAYYLDHWKANAVGVDLNRNFDAYWEYYAGTGYPSSDHYKGDYPGSEPEAAALIRLTESNQFLYTISYHTQGQVIYWNFENIDPVYDLSAQWVSRIAAQTGYSPINDFSTVDPAGYSDWAIYRHQIPSVVIEVASGDSPYLASQFQQIWQENLNIWELTVEEAMLYR
ncbi:MAG: M14 family zinc carboxypeptidase [Lachnospiraceae bacterium]|nr:M14 family zinc carboxypeptidase [Lachnospiraceae bacterium]